MSLKPEDALKNWCPISMGANNGPEFCYANKCMAWKWEYESPKTFGLVSRDKNDDSIPERPPNVPESYEWRMTASGPSVKKACFEWVEPESERLARRKGYCGMVPKEIYCG